MKGSQIVCECLIREGVEVIFGIPGGSILPLYDTLPQYPQLRHILMRHEQGAAHAADGYARTTGKVGVCFATSGPGATNLVTGIATAHMDSSPIIAITGQVVSRLIGRDAFQEADITGIVLPITKYRYLVPNAEELAETIKEAFYIARTGRPGPVLVDIPRDVFLGETEYKLSNQEPIIPGYWPKEMEKKDRVFQIKRQVEKAAELIEQAQAPVIIAGRGITISSAYEELKELAEKIQAPVVSTLLGLSAFPRDHHLSLGMLGMHGTYCANMTVSNADLIIAIGMRFDDRATGEMSMFAPKAKILHVDIDPAEIGKNIPVDVPIVGNAKMVLQFLNPRLEEQTHPTWIAQVEGWRYEHLPGQIRETDKLLPQYCVRSIYEITEGKAIIVTGVGQHQMWAAQQGIWKRSNSFITSGGLGPMGFGLPAGIGIKVARPEETVWVVDGDGSFQMTMHELAVLVQEKLPLKIAIIENVYLGMVRQWQELFYGHRYVATPLVNPDFVKIAEAYNIPARKVTQKDMVRPAIEQAMRHEGPFLIDFVVEPEENVYPMVPSGASLAEMITNMKGEVVA